MNVRTGEDGRWVLGNPNATCQWCGAPAAVNYAANGRAEVWHAPTDCCEKARARNRALLYGPPPGGSTGREVAYDDDGRASR